MIAHLRHLYPLALAWVLLGSTATHAAPSQEELLRLLDKMNARIDQLEKRNVELERHIKLPAFPSNSEFEKRVLTLEQVQDKITKGLDNDGISQYEPELTARLKAVEKDASSVKKAARKIDALDGLSSGVSLTTVAQRPYGFPQGTQDNNSQLNYRADVTVSLPLSSLGDVAQKVFAHFRIGQGRGLNAPLANLGAFASAPNAVAFRASGANPDDSVAILGQAWYQAAIPLPLGGFKPRSKETLELSFGKMDIFGFFDQNTIAGDESRQFLNSVFVHNPLLDAGGQIGVDANGFQPGFVAAYVNRSSNPETWRMSLGVFGTGRGANYQRFFSSPLVMAQAELSPKLLDGLGGNYRFYAWRNGQANELDGSIAHHTGWGVSADQKLGDGVTLFGRYGKLTKGKVPFDRALTLGSELNGSYWSRGGDAAGIAVGWLHSSGDFRATGGLGDLIGDGSGIFTYAPTGAERIAEFFYRYRITKQFEVSPDFQFIGKPGANPDARTVKVFGVRAQLAF